MHQLINTSTDKLKSIALCHCSCFSKSLSTQLGITYITKTLEWFLTRENCFLFHVINSEGLVIGYCGGFVPRFYGDGSTSGIMQYTMKQALLGVLMHPWLLFHKEIVTMYPLILKNLRKKIFQKSGAKKPFDQVAEIDKRAGLVVIGVHPEYRGTGVFQLLMREFEKKALERNLYKLVLTVKKNNYRAVQAYLNQGWFVVKAHPETLEMAKYLQ